MQQFLEGMGNTLILLYYGLPEVLFITAIVMLVYHAVRIIIAGINSAETVTEQMIRQVMTANAVQTFSILGALSSIAVMTGCLLTAVNIQTPIKSIEVKVSELMPLTWFLFGACLAAQLFSSRKANMYQTGITAVIHLDEDMLNELFDDAEDEKENIDRKDQ